MGEGREGSSSRAFSSRGNQAAAIEYVPECGWIERRIRTLDTKVRELEHFLWGLRKSDLQLEDSGRLHGFYIFLIRSSINCTYMQEGMPRLWFLAEASCLMLVTVRGLQ